ncbi:hypothetical protein AB833_06805 [Chromatiales bacterium (ex Bugula neritina AB1)]|nr:hypothetical protein AB833_06805 [Chromatiales bacterium (ex Bugula neritina AB1)]
MQKYNENYKLSSRLVNFAEELIQSNCLDSAKSLICSALVMAPGRSALIHKLGEIYDREGNLEAAGLCFRGVIPDAANEQYFQSSQLSGKRLPAEQCVSVQKLMAEQAEQISLSTPERNTTDKYYRQFERPHTESRENFVTVAVNGAIWFDGFNTLALDSERNIITDVVKGNEYSAYSASIVEAAVSLDGTACFLDGRSSSIYYHWMLDILPKLHILQKSGIALDSIDYFVVQARSGFQFETLKHCGIPKNKIHVIEGPVQHVKASRMIFPQLRNDLGERVYWGLGLGLGSWAPEYLKKVFLSADIKQSGRRIYISRAARGTRNIRNECVLISELEKRNFEVVSFEDYSVPEQAQLMAQSEMVVGVHGAGLTNLCFCHEGTRVIEIFGEYIVPCYWSLAAVKKLRYFQYMATSDFPVVDNPGQQVDKLREMELIVDIDDFMETVDRQLSTA